MSKHVKILGTGCTKCQQLTGVVKDVVTENALDVEIEKVEDIAEIMEFNVMSTPALVVDGAVVATGRIPTKDEVLDFLK